MLFPDYRPRRMRQNSAFRRMVRETELSANNLILPLFSVGGKGVKNPIASMPGVYQMSSDNLVKEARQAKALGIPAIILFGLPESKDPLGTQAYAENGVVQQAVAEVKNKVPDLAVITDVCLCAYTDHGHCGVVEQNRIDNDATLDLLARTALSHVKAGADMVAPSDMMDGRVAEIRSALDDENYSHIPIMATRPNIARPITAPSGRPLIRRPSSATAAPTRWTRPMARKPCARPPWTSRRAPTSSW
jgi:porphobilinogen synthase